MFDIDLAKSQTDENPVYYVQYAHARVCSVLREWGGDPAALADADLAPLASPHEAALAQKLARIPRGARARRARIRAAPRHATTCTTTWRRACIPTTMPSVSSSRTSRCKLARLALVAATRQVLANGLAVLGVSAPERM